MTSRIAIALPALRSMKIITLYLYDAVRFARHSNSLAINRTKNKITASIIYQYHVIEKGLTMPNRRWNFGHQKITSLVSDCNGYIDKFGPAGDEVRCAIGVLRTYLDEHTEAKIQVPGYIKDAITQLAHRVPDARPVRQKCLTKSEYLLNINSEFSRFAESRASVRNYSDESIPNEEMLRAVEIAKSAPSACNRQATRVYIVQDKDRIKRLLSFQNGNSGFGHLANKLVILTSDLSSFRGAAERNFAWIDCGIFAMNLMYALHHQKIGACPLNAGMSPSNETRVHEECDIPREEIICLFISCGYLPDNIQLANSQRKHTDEIVRFR